MTDERPTQPKTGILADDRHNLGFPPNPENPSRVRAGLSSADEIESFPKEEVEALRLDLTAMDDLDQRACGREDLRAVLVWIDRYVPRPVAVSEELAEVGGIAILSLKGEELDAVDLIRVNGRPFVPEAPVIENDVDEAAIEALHQAGRELVAKLDECAPHIANSAVFEFAHGIEYHGPQYGEALEAFRSLLDHNPDRFVHATTEQARVIAEAVAAKLGSANGDGVRGFLDAIMERSPNGEPVTVQYHPDGDWSVFDRHEPPELLLVERICPRCCELIAPGVTRCPCCLAEVKP